MRGRGSRSSVLTYGSLLVCLLSAAQSMRAAELKQHTRETFARYVRLTDARNGAELHSRDQFLWIDTLPEAPRKELYEKLRQGEIIIEPLETHAENGERIRDSDGMIHHWVGLVFIAGATLRETLALVQDYDHHQEIYKPDVARSKLLARNGNDFKIYLRLYKKKILTAVLNTEHEVHYTTLRATRATSRSRTTRIAEVEDPGDPGEREKPFGRDRGLLWGLHSWWRFQEKDGGVYVQTESVSLTRDVPPGLGWLIGPFIRSVPRELLVHILRATRTALTKPGKDSAEPKAIR